MDLNEQGYVVTDRQQKTSRDGVYAAGDVCIKNLRQVVTAVGDGALAATELERYAAAMQKKTGIKPEVSALKAAETADMTGGNMQSAGLFSEDILAQLRTVFSRMERPLVLKLALDARPVSAELKTYMEELAKLTDKLTVEMEENGDEGRERPVVQVCLADGTWTGLSFHGVPGGHEFTSFVLGLYNASGPGQPIDAETSARIQKIQSPVHMEILVSLSCTMCPELVTAAQRIAAASPFVTAEVYDLNHYPERKERYQVMSVPCLVINGKKPMFGKKNIQQLLDVSCLPNR